MRGNKRFLAAALAAGMTVSSICASPAFAAGPLTNNDSASGYDAETWAKLTDNVLEYDEVPMLVHEFNTNMRQTWDKLNDTRADIQKNAEELQSRKREMEKLKDTAESEMDITGLINYATQEAILKFASNKMASAADNILSKATISSIQKGESQLTMTVQSLMISYDSLRKQRDTLGHLQELYDRQYQMTVNKQAQGLATAREVLAAQSNQLSALGNLQSIDSGLMQMKPIIIRLAGWQADDDPEIAPIPAVDRGKIGELNLEEDTRKAIGNNSELIAQRHSAAGKTNDGVAARLAAIDEGDQKMTIKMQQLYDDVHAKASALEAAEVGYQSAQKSQASYDRMYNLGMLSEADYLGAKIAYYQKEVAYENADTALRLAIETYGWAVKGLVNPD